MGKLWDYPILRGNCGSTLIKELLSTTVYGQILGGRLHIQTCSEDFYLVISRKGYSGLRGRLTAKSPSVSSNESVIKISVAVPETLFAKPQLEAKVVIPQNAVSQPTIDATVLDNVREILEQKTGLDVSVALVENR